VETWSASTAVVTRDAAVQFDGAAGKTDTANAKADDGKKKLSGNEQPQGRPTGQTDDLLFPTPDELRAINAAQPKGAAVRGYTAYAGPDGVLSANDQPHAVNTGIKDGEKVAQAASVKTDGQPQSRSADQTDDLLSPTEEELRAMKGGLKGAAKAAEPERPAGKANTVEAKPVSADAAPKADANPPAPQARAVSPVISIKSDVDPESWAAYGGWYRQDYAIFYRPVGHKDKFIYSWLFLTGPQAPKGDKSPAAAVFDVLANKDAQGSCTKCHSVDDIRGKGRLVNFAPPSVESKQGRFTNFIHEPHFGVVGDRGCLTCHQLEKGRPYLKSFEQGNPQSFASNFGAVDKDLCQTCHTSSKTRQDCLTCHKYHVDGVITPIMSTRLPAQ
jgi:hypothetical protein